jgi:hypothetical protein
LLTSFQLIKKTKCIGASSSMRIRPHEHADDGGTTAAERTCFSRAIAWSVGRWQ